MAKRKICRSLAVVLAFGMCVTALGGCGSEKSASGKTEIEVVSYKPEAVAAFEEIEKRFNETHEDIHLKTIRILSQSVEISIIPISWMQICLKIFRIWTT